MQARLLRAKQKARAPMPVQDAKVSSEGVGSTLAAVLVAAAAPLDQVLLNMIACPERNDALAQNDEGDDDRGLGEVGQVFAAAQKPSVDVAASLAERGPSRGQQAP